MRYLMLLAAAVLLAGCGNPGPADVRITCADVVNQGLASACDTASPASAAAPLGTITSGGTVDGSQVIVVHADITNSGGTDESVQAITAYDQSCGPIYTGYAYSVVGIDSYPVKAGGTFHAAVGSNCGAAPNGPLAGMMHIYPAGTFQPYFSAVYGWTPDAYAAVEIDHWVVNVTMAHP